MRHFQLCGSKIHCQYLKNEIDHLIADLDGYFTQLMDSIASAGFPHHGMMESDTESMTHFFVLQH